MVLENLTNNPLNSASKPKKRRNNSDLNESSNEIDTPVKKSKLDLSTTNNYNNEHSSSLESITIISDDEDDNKSIEFEKKPNTNSDDIEVIELSDTEYECKNKNVEAISSKPITGLLKLEKTEKGQQKLTSVTMNNNNNISEDNDIIIENPTTSYAASIQDNVVPYSNPSKIDKNDLKAQVAEGLNRQQTNRNCGFEEQIRSLIKPLLNTLESKPDPCQKFTDFVSPKSLKVKLMPHQIYSMHWLKWRESNIPYGAILADDMGLGKTLTTLAYLRMVKDNYEKKHKAEQESDEEKEKEEAKKEDDENEDEDDKENDFDEIKFLKKLTNKKKFKINDSSKKLKTLIVLPASLLHQWQGEIENKFEKNSFKIHVYHEADRKKNSQNLENNDIVFTTYEIISREVSVPDKEGFTPKSNTPLSRIKWKRIILDEAHRIKNHTTKANKAICTLKAKYRIALTGTPIHNSLNDLYSLVKFMNFDPLNDFSLWKYLFASETFSARTRNQVQSEEREKRVGTWLQLLADYLILRRTKLDKFPGTDKCIVNLPEKKVEEIRFKLGPNEEIIYQQIFNESKEKVNQFLDDHQKRLIANRIGLETGEGGSKKSSLTDIFVYLLRLRQACCHMSLLAECLDQEHIGNYDIDGDGSILLRSDGSSFNNHKNKDYDDLEEESSGDDDEDDDEYSTNKKKEIISDGKDLDALNKINSSDLLKCLEKSYMSSKIEKSLSIINEILNDFPKDKLIIVSQWTSMLGIIARQLKKQSIEYCEIKGEVSLAKRNEIVESFNDKSNTEQQVMLLSLCAGGVGLNLIGANRMFLLDIHWNPALEKQCADRIYRVGQTKNVTIYKLLCEETIEERIQQIQQAKIQIAERVCRSGAETSVPGAAGSTKLTISDFKLLFKDFGTK